MQRVMDGCFSEGEEILKLAISMFEALPHMEKYVLNIAAAYNFIGESKRRSMEFYSSFYFYDKAISLCEEKGLIRGIPIFNTNAGQAAYDMGDYSKARKYIERAIEAYKQQSSLWGRSTAYGYMSLLLIKEGKLDEALASITKAEACAKVIQNPYEMALICRIKGEIRKSMEFNPKLNDVFSGYLMRQVADYCDEGLALLKDIRNCYEFEILMNLKVTWW